MVKAHTVRQAGHPESWLCSIFANLTDDRVTVLRDAWLASMVLCGQANRLAERTTYNRTRRLVLGIAADEAEATPPPHAPRAPPWRAAYSVHFTGICTRSRGLAGYTLWPALAPDPRSPPRAQAARRRGTT